MQCDFVKLKCCVVNLFICIVIFVFFLLFSQNGFSFYDKTALGSLPQVLLNGVPFTNEQVSRVMHVLRVRGCLWTDS